MQRSSSPSASEMAAAKGWRDARGWDEAGYRRSIIRERELRTRTVFRASFAPPSSSPNEAIVVASSDGCVAAYSVLPHERHSEQRMHFDKRSHMKLLPDAPSMEPRCAVRAHKGPVYDLKFYRNGQEDLILSCGDDGRIKGWKCSEILSSEVPLSIQGSHLNPIIDLKNPQHEGSWGARSPIPENNGIATNEKEGSIFSASGDACAYSWDVETGKRKMVFRGHSDYLHCIVARQSSNQIITGSEDGTVRLWDCRSGLCTQVINPGKKHMQKEYSWVSSIATDASENWLVCGTGQDLSVWSLLSYEMIFNVDIQAPVQDVLFDGNQILAVGTEPLLTRYSINGAVLSKIQCAPPSAFSLSLHPSGVVAVGGFGGLVDVISEFGSHLSVFSCRGLPPYP